jgi:hypothetical protein
MISEEQLLYLRNKENIEHYLRQVGTIRGVKDILYLLQTEVKKKKEECEILKFAIPGMIEVNKQLFTFSEEIGKEIERLNKKWAI